MSSEADDHRFLAFVQSTTPEDRDTLAFCEFTYALHSAVRCASVVVPCDDRPEGQRERDMLLGIVGNMLFSVLSRVELSSVVMNAEGIGFAVRYGIVDTHPNGLDGVTDTDSFERLAQAGFAAEAAHACRQQHHEQPPCSRCRLFEAQRLPS